MKISARNALIFYYSKLCIWNFVILNENVHDTKWYWTLTRTDPVQPKMLLLQVFENPTNFNYFYTYIGTC